jgi:hypothetical protein
LNALKRDTSGANASEIAKLEKELANDTQTYQDELIDQEIDKLQKQNEEAAKQRDKQIKLLEAQKEIWIASGKATAEAKQILEDSLSAINNGTDLLSTSLGILLAKAANTNEMSDEEKT